MTSDDFEFFVHALLDAVLTSDSRLSVLYEKRGPLSGAFMGCTELAHRETGLRYAMRSVLKEDIPGKADELCAAIRAQVSIAGCCHACSPATCLMRYSATCAIACSVGYKNHQRTNLTTFRSHGCMRCWPRRVG